VELGENSDVGKETRGRAWPGRAPPHYYGHMERLRERFREAGAEALSDYELLEAVLFRALPRRDLKLLAKTLIATFGSFAEVISAPEATARPDQGIGSGQHHRTQARAGGGEPAYSRRGKKAAGAVILVGGARLLPLPRRPSRTASSSGCSSSTNAIKSLPTRCSRPARSITRRSIRAKWSCALELSATAIILVHNHPSGDPTPSRADIQMTQQIIAVANPLRISVHDHIIVGKEAHASLKGLKLI
jgi:DNA repair protein RadC